MSDSVADFLTRLRNAVIADYDDVLVPASRFNHELARLLKEEGYVEDFAREMVRPSTSKRGTGKRRSETEMIRVNLKYTEDREPVISGLKRVSKPGRRSYVTVDELPRVLGGMGTAIITTSRGVMTANEAKRQRVGGEVVAYVW
jgi:small subunit ribosomal protein S8